MSDMSGFFLVTPQVRHPEQSEGSPECGFVPMYGYPSRKKTRSG